MQGILSTWLLEQLERPIAAYRSDRWLCSPMGSYSMIRESPDDAIHAPLLGPIKIREYGPGPDPWARSLEPVLRLAACGLWLRERGSTRDLDEELERFQPFLEHRLPAWTGVPPGTYDLVLVVREDGKAETRSKVVGAPLATVELRASVETKVAVTLSNEHL